jgi:hypothetical protein
MLTANVQISQNIDCFILLCYFCGAHGLCFHCLGSHQQRCQCYYCLGHCFCGRRHGDLAPEPAVHFRPARQPQPVA